MKFLVTVACFVACINTFAQTNIDAMEYFFDTDPGLGNGTAISVSPALNQDLNLSLNTSGLTVGFHTLVIRAKHQSGAWGIQDSRVVYVASQSVVNNTQLTDMEYYYDSDPGFGNGTAITIPSASSVTVSPALSTTSLSSGFHILHVRAKDIDGNWGIPEIRTMYLTPGNVTTQGSIVDLEYFFDTEPGYGNGTPLTVTSGTQINVVKLITAASLSNGFHSISLRAKDNDGQWGFAETRTFFVDEFSQVAAIEYYVDTDPGEGAAASVTIATGGEVDVNFVISTSSFSGGSHTLGVRAARSDGSWGNTSTTTFNVLETQTITFNALASVTFGDAPFDLAGTSSSGLAVTYASSDPSVATISGSTVTIVGAGSTSITASQAGDGSYAQATDVIQSLIVNKADQSITFDVLPPKGLNDPAFTLNASSTSSLGIVYSSSNLTVATISGNTVTITGAGSTDITASQPGSTNYNAASNVVQTLTVLPVNTAPTLAGQASSGFYINEPVTINSGITITDNEGILASATVAITSGLLPTEDQLLYTLAGTITASYDPSTGVLAINGTGAVADYQSVLRSIQYDNTSLTPNTADRAISFVVNDGTNTSNEILSVVSINKPPAITAPPRNIPAGGNFVFMISDILSDPDGNLDLSTLSIVSKQGAMISINGNIITVNYSILPEYEGTDELTISVCDFGGQCQTQVVAVDVSADIEIFNGISANADNINDFFKVKFLPAGSRVTVLNRWGDVVFEKADYDNTDPQKRFEGDSTNGTDLTSGTYFYKIQLPDGRQRTGYLQVKR